MVPRPLAAARAMRSRTCAHVIQPCLVGPRFDLTLALEPIQKAGGRGKGWRGVGCNGRGKPHM